MIRQNRRVIFQQAWIVCVLFFALLGLFHVVDTKAEPLPPGIGNYYLNWVSGDYSTINEEMTALEAKPERNRSNYSPNYYYNNYVMKASFSYGEGPGLGAGEMQVRFPKYIFFGRDGKGTGVYTSPLNLADLGWKEITVAGSSEIVYTNTQPIASGTEFGFSVRYSVFPDQVPDGTQDGSDNPNNIKDSYYKDDITVDFVILDKPVAGQPQTELETYTSDPITLRMDTDAKITSPSKTRFDDYTGTTLLKNFGMTDAEATEYLKHNVAVSYTHLRRRRCFDNIL